ncbi:dynein heavy chain 7, axonemal-like [Harpegnathos saltator]|uniref:dynein heavy chain 7, axonemal-like n=1 Tax=Harpegnathos saltator TaxID=610380 RepID=UPI000DBEE658|nr:dynein heavy chain 7, axonemal-like [Harpegnathos saltator]
MFDCIDICLDVIYIVYINYISKNKRQTKRSITDRKKRDGIASLGDDYYTSLRQQRANFRIHLIRRIKGLRRIESDADPRKDETKKPSDDAEGPTVSDDIIDAWLTEEDKNLLRYYHYILHDVSDAHAGTLDSDTLKKIRATVPAEWQKRHDKCLAQLIQEIKRDYVMSMKKSIVDFTLQEPFGEVDAPCALVSIVCIIIFNINANFNIYHHPFIKHPEWKAPTHSRVIAEPFSPEYSDKYRRIKSTLERRSIILYHPCIRKILDYWYREYGDIKQVDKLELASFGKSYDLPSFDYKFSRMLRSTNDKVLQQWLSRICDILVAASKKKNLPATTDFRYKRFFNCLAYVMENQLRDLCLRSIEDYIDYLVDVGVS